MLQKEHKIMIHVHNCTCIIFPTEHFPDSMLDFLTIFPIEHFPDSMLDFLATIASYSRTNTEDVTNDKPIFVSFVLYTFANFLTKLFTRNENTFIDCKTIVDTWEGLSMASKVSNSNTFVLLL